MPKAHPRTRRLLSAIALFLMFIGASTFVTTLVVMGHNLRWNSTHNELIAAPLLVTAVFAAVGGLFWLVDLND